MAFRTVVSRKLSPDVDKLFQGWCDSQHPPITRSQGVVVILQEFLTPRRKEILKFLTEQDALHTREKTEEIG